MTNVGLYVRHEHHLFQSQGQVVQQYQMKRVMSAIMMNTHYVLKIWVFRTSPQGFGVLTVLEVSLLQNTAD